MLDALRNPVTHLDTTSSRDGNVYSTERILEAPKVDLVSVLKMNHRLQMDGAEFLEMLPSASFPVAFFDPQYRGILDKMSYGNEGRDRFRARCALPQMTSEQISQFLKLIDRTLMPSGHLFLWIDKFHLCTGFAHWYDSTDLTVVDMLTWNKGRMGMGYRTRRTSEHIIVMQKAPKRAKGVWQSHDIPDVWDLEDFPHVWKEKVSRNGHTHTKPVELQARLIEAVSNSGDVVIDPAAGSFSVLEACHRVGRNFLGCDING